MSLAEPTSVLPAPASAPLILGADELLLARPFTHPDCSRADLRVLDRLVSRLRAALHTGLLHPSADGLLHYAWEDWHGDQELAQRLLVRPNANLRAGAPLVVVGFFGQRRRDADSTALVDVDNALLREMAAQGNLLCYFTSALAGGEFANLVLCADEVAKAHWSRSVIHARAVRELAPICYHSIRLHNGAMANGLTCGGGVALATTKYYDYDAPDAPGIPWRAQRTFTPPLTLC